MYVYLTFFNINLLLPLLRVEKKNDDFRRYFHRKINRWDACTSLRLVEKRQEALRCYQREMRAYTKRNASFWYEGGKLEAAEKVPRISAVEVHQMTHEAQNTVIQRKRIPQSATELRKLRIPELVQLLSDLTGCEQSLPMKPRKPDIISKITEVAILRSE